MNLTLQVMIGEVLVENPEALANYRDGKAGFFGLFIRRSIREPQIMLIHNCPRNY
jgi:hypothetical protein